MWNNHFNSIGAPCDFPQGALALLCIIYKNTEESKNQPIKQENIKGIFVCLLFV